jgi:hypothetical protein
MSPLCCNLLDRKLWTVIADFGLDAGPQTLRYPDVVVDRAGGALGDYSATAPVLLVEVLSPSTSAVDLGDKVAEYPRLPSLSACLAFAPTEPRAGVWTPAGNRESPLINSGYDNVVRIAELSLDRALAAVDAGIRPR